MNYKDFSLIIKYKRIEKGYTQKDFSRLLAISQSKYNKIENGNMEPSFILLQLISRYLEIDLNEILEIKKPISKHESLYD
jgi:transcriptional regulator with XRE-family HTH domain